MSIRKSKTIKTQPSIDQPQTGGENQPTKDAFPIVCIGASAGGLEAFEKFFHHIAPDSGMGFVLVSHLDPSHASILTEIMQRSTTMTVIEVQDQMQVMPNSVYVIPPNREMAIFHGVLQLSIPEQPRGLRMPIDTFLRSLAEDQGERSIGIIMSGTGTDGTLGLRAIQGAGGLTLAQDPASAKYDSMPSSAIKAGYVNIVLPAEKMPEALLPGLRSIDKPSLPMSAGMTSGLNHILMQLRRVTGQDFSQYKKSTISRRIDRRMSLHNIEDREVYVRYLKEHPEENKLLFKELLINVTSFFRDPQAFDVLKHEILPQLLANKPDDYVFRVWVAGCATGEEAYSVAMLLRELMDENHREFKVLLYATDIDPDSIALARAGFYPPNIAQDVHPERLYRHFVKEDSGFRIKKNIREMVVYAVQNIIKDPPFTKLDLLCCRNLMIYLEPELQSRLIPVFHYALKQQGVLFLSPSESIGNYPELFKPKSRKWKFYQATGAGESTRAVMSGGLSWTKDANTLQPDQAAEKIKETNFAELTRRALLQSYAPASVMTDHKGVILFVHGDTGRYLRPAPGQASLNVVDMAREGLQMELRAAFNNVEHGRPAVDREVSLKTGDEFHKVSISVRPFSESDNNFMLVSFRDIVQPEPVTHIKGTAPDYDELRRIEELERELTYSRENLQATIEAQQASNEELKSTNEELQSTNEELQSTNEELETSKEELQSVNEELITVNAELQAKIEQLIAMENDMKNLLDNINIGTVFLDNRMRIRRFTREAAQIYRLVPSDIGRSLCDIKSDIEGDYLLSAAQKVLDTLVPFEREMRAAGGKWYLASIRPYRTLDNVIDGVVLTFTDITKRVNDEAEIRSAQEFSTAIVDTVREPLVVLDEKMNIVSASRSFYDAFKVTPEYSKNRSFYEINNRQWAIPKLRELLENILTEGRPFEEYLVEQQGSTGMRLNARRISCDKPLILLAIDMT